MADYEVGFGRPPKQHQFAKGVSGNPAGRPPKPKPAAVADVVRNTLNATMQFPEAGRTKTITRTEVGFRKMVDKAMRGDLAAAAQILRARANADRFGSVGVETIEIRNWLEDFPGQTADQRTEETAAANRAVSSKRDNRTQIKTRKTR
jgi:hypothetical protein